MTYARFLDPCDCGVPDSWGPFAPVSLREHETLARSAAVDVPPDETPRVPTGEPGLDHLLRGGLARTSTMVLFGADGHGKTRSALRVVGNLGRSLVISLEQPKTLTVDTARSAGADINGMFVLDELDGWEGEAKDCDAILLDSVSVVPRPVRTLRLLREWATRTGGIVIALSQVNGRGKPFGPNALRHWGDYTVRCERSDAPGHTTWQVEKSRYSALGSADVPIVRDA